MDSSVQYISVILPLRLEWNPWYYVPADFGPVSSGDRVTVRFAGRKYIGVVYSSGNPDIGPERIMPVISVERGLSPVTGNELRLWEFAADYYLCTAGEVYKAAYPALKNAGEMVSARAKSRTEASNVRKISALENRMTRLGAVLEKRKLLLSRASKPGTKAKYAEAVAKAEAEILRISSSIASIHSLSETVGENVPLSAPFTLSTAQSDAVAAIKEGFSRNKPVLLEGVTGSGKTEIYISLALEMLASGRSVLYLVPEISVSRQLEKRMRAVFGDALLVFHSKETAARRNSVVEAVRKGGYIVLGTRSAVFLPHTGLGLVIIDEEHDPSYKQDAPAPRYNGRDTAVMLARINGSNVLLGTATPSLESIYNCRTGLYEKVELKERYFGQADAEVEIVDTSSERRKHGMKGSFSYRLISRINEALSAGGQVLLLRARRAYSPSVQCSACGDIPHCPHCNVPMSWHRNEGALICHYCGLKFPFNGQCSKCGSPMEPLGTGTQRVEEEAKELFPQARVERLDGDTSSIAAKEMSIIKDFEQGRIDILVGTQIVAKGFDFGRLSLVAVLQADSLLGQQDFRADERALQLLEQFRGRSSRRGQKGCFIIQTARPSHPVYSLFADLNSRTSLSESMLSERYAYGYPPFSRIVIAVVKDRSERAVEELAGELAGRIRAEFGMNPSGFITNNEEPVTVLGPYPPPVDKVSDLYIRHIRISLKKDSSLPEEKRRLNSLVLDFEKIHSCPGKVILDVDP
ncbi:MAG: primosomal protein N' [Bacteroidales bacterium]|nr:primosomal protein N' [Bacteroidales bacterium]